MSDEDNSQPSYSYESGNSSGEGSTPAPEYEPGPDNNDDDDSAERSDHLAEKKVQGEDESRPESSYNDDLSQDVRKEDEESHNQGNDLYDPEQEPDGGYECNNPEQGHDQEGQDKSEYEVEHEPDNDVYEHVKPEQGHDGEGQDKSEYEVEHEPDNDVYECNKPEQGHEREGQHKSEYEAEHEPDNDGYEHDKPEEGHEREGQHQSEYEAEQEHDNDGFEYNKPVQGLDQEGQHKSEYEPVHAEQSPEPGNEPENDHQSDIEYKSQQQNEPEYDEESERRLNHLEREFYRDQDQEQSEGDRSERDSERRWTEGTRRSNGVKKSGPMSLMEIEIPEDVKEKIGMTFTSPKSDHSDPPNERHGFSGGGDDSGPRNRRPPFGAPTQHRGPPPRPGFGNMNGDFGGMEGRKRGFGDQDRFGKRPRTSNVPPYAATGANAEPFVPRHQAQRKMNSDVAIESIPFRGGPGPGPGPGGDRPMPPMGPPNPRIFQCVENAVTPLCRLPIPAQHNKKHALAMNVLDALRKEITDANPAANTWFLCQESKYQNILDMKTIIPPPMVDGYRNKCEFTIGMNPAENNILTIGFIVEPETSLVGPVDHVRHIPDRMKHIVFTLQRGLRDSGIPPFDIVRGTGHWMNLTVRLTTTGEAMLVIAFNPRNMNPLQVRDVKEKLTQFFAEGMGCQCNISSLYFNMRKEWESGHMELLYGKEVVTENLLGKVFDITPDSYFTVNVKAAERVIRAIGDIVHLNLSCTLIDVCCGTGSIGLSLAGQVGQVLGLDIVESAVQVAMTNAMKNNVTNCEYYPGSAEEHLGNLFRRVAFTDVICVVDPPRGGLAPKAIGQIRRNEAIKKLVFVCSDPFSCMKSFADLSRAPSNNVRGDPFIPVRAIPIDTFPHTNNFTVVFLFLRLSMTELVNPQSVNIDRYQPVPAGPAYYPESAPYGHGQPGPDLRWQKVTPGGADESGLSAEQVAWLNQMTEAYGEAFERLQWTETFRRQNIEAGMAAAAAATGGAPAQPTAPATTGQSEADSAAAWAAYSKQYREYKEWWDTYGATYGANYQQPTAPAVAPAAPAGQDAWAAYGSSYYANWSGQQQQQPQPPLPKGPAPPLPKTPAPK